MQYYLGVKRIEAEPMERDGVPGYKVVYPGGYESWSPKDTFERAYMPMDGDGTTVSESMVDAVIAKDEIMQIGNRTSLVKTTLKNGFILVQSSSAASAENFSSNIGTSVCRRKIKDQVWALMGFLLASALNGFDGKSLDDES